MGLFKKIQFGLAKTRGGFSKGVKGALGRGRLTEDTLDKIEELLIEADICFEATEVIIDKIRKECLGQFLSSEKLSQMLEQFSSEFLLESPIIPHEIRPHVMLILGVNGVGKTTSIAKLANFFKKQGESVLVAAGDTFRAGAIEQLEIWCDRVGVDLVKHAEKSDAAAVVYDAYSAAKSRKKDLMIIDTAGRLHNKGNLMEELKKTIRVMKKHDESLPHETLLVIDGNTGQNSLAQAKAFHNLQKLDGFIVTKLDGTAKGGSLLSTNYEMKVPVRWVGVGEGLDDLVPFSKQAYIKGMFGEEDFDIPLEQQEILGKYKGLI